jgi:O-antigen/teichoic acid export membrane protein
MLAQGTFELTFRPAYFNAIVTNAANEKRIFNAYFSLTLLTSTLAVVMVALFSKSIVELFFGPKYHSGLNLLLWISLGHGALIMSYAYYTRLYAYKLTKIILLIRGLSAILCLIVETQLIYTLGLLGAALACPIYFCFELLILAGHAKFFFNPRIAK